MPRRLLKVPYACVSMVSAYIVCNWKDCCLGHWSKMQEVWLWFLLWAQYVPSAHDIQKSHSHNANQQGDLIDKLQASQLEEPEFNSLSSPSNALQNWYFLPPFGISRLAQDQGHATVFDIGLISQRGSTIKLVRSTRCHKDTHPDMTLDVGRT